MATDDERRRVAAALRGLTSNVYGLRKSYESEGCSILCEEQADYYQMCKAVCGYLPPEHMHPCDYEELHDHLADLIDPGPAKAPTSSDTAPTRTDATATCDASQDCRDNVACDPTERGIDSIYEWCRERLEGADGDEDELYCAIMRAIEEYRHTELVTAHTVRPVDREALLALADEMDKDGRIQRERQKAGKRWFIDGLDVREYARRVREACGEAVA